MPATTREQNEINGFFSRIAENQGPEDFTIDFLPEYSNGLFMPERFTIDENNEQNLMGEIASSEEGPSFTSHFSPIGAFSENVFQDIQSLQERNDQLTKKNAELQKYNEMLKMELQATMALCGSQQQQIHEQYERIKRLHSLFPAENATDTNQQSNSQFPKQYVAQPVNDQSSNAIYITYDNILSFRYYKKPMIFLQSEIEGKKQAILVAVSMSTASPANIANLIGMQMLPVKLKGGIAAVIKTKLEQQYGLAIHPQTFKSKIAPVKTADLKSLGFLSAPEFPEKVTHTLLINDVDWLEGLLSSKIDFSKSKRVITSQDEIAQLFLVPEPANIQGSKGPQEKMEGSSILVVDGPAKEGLLGDTHDNKKRGRPLTMHFAQPPVSNKRSKTNSGQPNTSIFNMSQSKKQDFRPK